MKLRHWLLSLTLPVLVSACGSVGVTQGSGGAAASGGATTLAISGTPSTAAAPGLSYSFTPTVSGGAGTLTFSISGKPSWAAFSTATGALTGTPATTDAGAFSGITISVSDGSHSVTLAAFAIDVSASALTITGTPATTATVGVAYSFVPTASGGTGSLTFSISGKPGWAAFSTVTGALTGTPATTDAGAFSGITISVTDGAHTASLAVFSITVPAVALTITGTPSTAAVVGSAYSFMPSASGGTAALSFTITGKPAWAAFNTATGALTGTPASTDVGTFPGIVIGVTDGTHNAALPSFTITVASGGGSGYVPPTSACSSALVGSHRTYNIGPGQTYTDTTNFPWLSLVAGDVVNVYYQSTPYRTHIALKAQGTVTNPVVINGVTDVNCNRPEITGVGATAGTGAPYAADRASTGWENAPYTNTDDVFEIWWGLGNYGAKPDYITIQNLKITNPASGAYAGSSGINAITADNLLVQNCEITNNFGWGIFLNTKNDSPAGQETSYRPIIRANLIYGNGVQGSYLYHNLYIQGYRALIEGNYIGALMNGAQGSSLKDRSSGTIVRYNTIVAAARAIDLVESEGGHGTVDADPLYRDAWVYGNIIINDDTIPGAGSGDMIHWGYDNCFYYPCNPPGSFVEARTGTLHFYDNTVIANIHGDQWALFDQQSNGDTINPHNIVELQNNILWNQGTATMTLAIDMGDVRFLAKNWISNGWVNANIYNASNTVSVTGTANLIIGANPMLDPTTYRPVTGSPVIGQAASGTATAVLYEYANPVGAALSVPGAVSRATANDLGALEHH